MELEHRVQPEDLARSLIREFFIKMNYSSTLQQFEKEDVRPRVKMTKIDLIKLLSMERLIKNNKMRANPQQTILEILTEYLFSKFKSRSTGFQNAGDLTNIDDDTKSNISQNMRNQEYSDHSAFGSQQNLNNKMLGIPSNNQNKRQNEYSHSVTNGSNISNGSNIIVNSYLSSKTNGFSSELSSQSNHTGISSASTTAGTSFYPNNHQQVQSLDHKPPKSAGNNIFGHQTQSQNHKFPTQIKNPLEEKGSDYLSILEEQNKRNAISKNNQIANYQQQNNNSTPPFLKQQENQQNKITNNLNKNDDDGEFRFESRRGNMKKGVRQASNEKENPQQPKEQITSIRTSMNNFGDSNIQSSTTTSKYHQNSDLFANINEALNNAGTQNSKLDFNDPVFGEVNSDSRIISKIPNKEAEERPISRQNRQLVQTEKIGNLPSSNLQAPQKEEDGSKQFNFFNKKKKQEDIEQQSSQNDKYNKDALNDFDDLDQMMGQGNSGFQQYENSKKKKGIFDEIEDLDFTSNGKSKQKSSQREISSQNGNGKGNNINSTDHVKINFFEPGVVNFTFVPPKINFAKTAGIQTFSKKNISSLSGSDTQNIKQLLFSQAQNKFLPTSWSQGFILNDNDDCFYGLFQKEGGPCGVIACVQAFYLKYLFYVYPTTSKTAGRNITDYKNKTLRENCLVAALAEILFNCRGEDNIIKFAVIQNTAIANSTQQSIPIDNCGYISVKVQTIEQAYDALHPYKTDYIGLHNHGVTTFLYSVILTKGAKNIQLEMDTPDNSIIGHHGHCSQEQVNLFLTGKARSNCFDGEKVLDGDYKLKGIDQRSPFGFMTIFEHLKYIEVGSYLKTPEFPIWIICKEYHYSVIFAKDYRANENPQQPHFDLVYYDELYNPQDKIILTVTQKKYAKQIYSSSQSSSDQQHFLFKRDGKNDDDEDMIPVIELVMRTKWGKDINVDWNGTQPIL